MVHKLFSQSLELYQGELSQQFGTAFREIGHFLGKRKLKILIWDEIHVAVSTTLKIELPPRGNYNNIDIREHEPVLLVFNMIAFPGKAPKVYSDRLDFPKNELSHLYVSQEGRPAPLCLIRGNIDEWFAEKQISDLIQQIQSWFSDAASGALVEDGNRFDPIRLEGYCGTSIYKYKELADIVNNRLSVIEDENFSFGLFLETEESDNSFPSFRLLRTISDVDEYKKAKELLRQTFDSKSNFFDKNLQFGLIFWNKDLNPVADYFVNLPRNYAQLLEFGTKYNIDFGLGFLGFFSILSLKQRDNVPLLVGIKRPKNIIGYNSDIEFINFYITVTDEDLENGVLVKNVPVSFQQHNEPLSVAKAKEISNYDNQLGDILVIGAGALGSKVVMHLARGGHTDMTIVDGDKLSPHNLVRHALLNGQLGESKGSALKTVITELYPYDTLTSLIKADIDGEDMFTGKFRNLLRQYNWLFDFTASKRFLNFLTRERVSEPINICRASLIDEGKLGVMFIEGVSRNPRIDDIQVLFYDLYKEKQFISDYLQNEFEKSKNDRSVVNVGVGCNSETTILADEAVSIHAAAFSNVIKTEATRATFSDKGFIYVNSIDTKQGFEVKSYSFIINPLNIINCGDWEIRFKDGIEEILKSEMGKAMPHETGGVFIGVINKKTKCIHVTDVILAPPDSEANESCFFRGVEGLSEEIDKIKKLSGQTFGYVGEWHSHPFGPMGLSSTDARTANRFLKEFRRFQNPIPVFITIVTPYGLVPHIIE